MFIYVKYMSTIIIVIVLCVMFYYIITHCLFIEQSPLIWVPHVSTVIVNTGQEVTFSHHLLD